MPTTLKSTKKLSFKLHPSILISTIQDQAHGIDKAIAELVMNSVDAGANQVEISYDGTFLQVSDNGKGFNKKQVMDYFRTFGMPHVDDDAHSPVQTANLMEKIELNNRGYSQCKLESQSGIICLHTIQK